MKYIFLFLMFIVGGNASATEFNSPRVVRVYDGDTFFVDLPGVDPFFGKALGVRIFGIDSPELRSKNKCEKEKALKAKAFLQKKLTGSKLVQLKSVKKDKYFRIVADVHLDGVPVRQQLIDAKLAYPYFGATKQKVDWCK